ncbi:MAG: hypothetical protein LBS87_00620 [Puniceicoccales bacterium]|jgi:hypothetical protein|nr:hypothetical protein [Puniceicoccales bacterium]
MKRSFDTNEDARLHNLLQIKRLERPDSAKWTKFDRCFERKRLSAIVDKKVLFGEKILSIFASRRFACAMCGICLVVIAAIGLGRGSRCCSYYSDDFLGSGNDVRLSYVRDDIMCNVENVDLKTKFNHISKGVAYVCDSISNKDALIR